MLVLLQFSLCCMGTFSFVVGLYNEGADCIASLVTSCRE